MIQYVTGDVTRPIGDGLKAIVQVVNNKGGMGAGVALAIMNRWRIVEQSYRAWYRGETGQPFELGSVQFIPVEDDIIVVNMIAQHGFGNSITPPIRYEALKQCLQKVNDGLPSDAVIAAPRLGCGLARGTWNKVEPILADTMKFRQVTVYDLPGVDK